MLPATALAEGTETANADHPHTADTQHPVCGGGTCTDGGSHQSQTWQGISDLSDIATGGGNYYLTTDVTLSETWTPVNGTVLCLNGYSITENAGTPGSRVPTITVGNNVTFTLTDCAEMPGKITHAEGTLDCGVLVQANGTFTMYGGSITGNTDTMGGGVFVAGGGKFTMYGGIITENTASDYEGGGVYVTANGEKKGQFIMNGGTITENTSNGTTGNRNGGGVYVTEGEFTMNGGAITGNTANGNGGGVAVGFGGTVTMTGGSITGNNANTNGGGVFVAGKDTVAGMFTMTGGSITDNNANADGGGVWANAYGTITVSGAVQITGNVKGGAKNGAVYTGGTKSNVYLYTGKNITIGTDGLNDTARIGVTKQSSSTSSPVQIATNATGSLADYRTIFSMDRSYTKNYIFTKNENNLYFGPHQHNWTYTATANGTTITAICEACETSGGSVTISAPTSPTYDGTAKAAGVSLTEDWKGGTVSDSDIFYSKKISGGLSGPLDQAPVNAGSYIASVTANGQTASVEYTIAKATPTVSDFTFTPPANLTYDGTQKVATVTPNSNIIDMGAVTVKYFKGETQLDSAPTDAGDYTVKISVAAGDNYNETNDLTDSGWTFTIGKVNYPNTSTLTVKVPADMVSNSIYLPLPILKGDARYDKTVETSLATKTDESDKTLFPDNSFIWDAGGTGVTFKTNSVPAGYSATMTFHIHGGTNYNNYDFIVPVSVVARTQKTLAVRMDGWTYGSTANTPQYIPPEGFTGTPTITYTKKNADGSFTELTTVPTDAGDYKVTVVCETPFVIYSGFAEFSIAKRSSSSSGSPTYSVTTPDQTEHGSVTVSPKNAKQGSTVTITVTPDAGYVLGDLGVTDRNGKDVTLTKKSDTQYTFVMPAGQVEVKASFVKDDVGQSDFADVKSGDYFYDAVRWAVEKGVTNGTDATHFSPDASCTRAQIVTFLWRAAGSPEVKDVSGFMDVAEGSYYAKAVAWAVEQGITNGTDATHFSPDASCTRAQSVTFLYRALGQKPSGRAAFADVLADSYYADAVAWAAEKGITNGTDATHFSPNAVCTRAQIVTFLYRAYQGK